MFFQSNISVGLEEDSHCVTWWKYERKDSQEHSLNPSCVSSTLNGSPGLAHLKGLSGWGWGRGGAFALKAPSLSWNFLQALISYLQINNSCCHLIGLPRFGSGGGRTWRPADSPPRALNQSLFLITESLHVCILSFSKISCFSHSCLLNSVGSADCWCLIHGCFTQDNPSPRKSPRTALLYVFLRYSFRLLTFWAQIRRPEEHCPPTGSVNEGNSQRSSSFLFNRTGLTQ